MNNLIKVNGNLKNVNIYTYSIEGLDGDGSKSYNFNNNVITAQLSRMDNYSIDFPVSYKLKYIIGAKVTVEYKNAISGSTAATLLVITN